MEKFLEALSPGWIGTLLGITGLIVALATYLLTRQRSILSYEQLNDSLIGASDSKLSKYLKIQYKGIDIPRLTRSIIVFWNEGEKTITKNNIITSDPLRIETSKDSSILSISIIKSSRNTIEIKCDIDHNESNTARLYFDFLDHDDGCTLEILHTGDIKSIRLCGTIIGIPAGVKNRGRITRGQNTRLFKHFLPDNFIINYKVNEHTKMACISLFTIIMIHIIRILEYPFKNTTFFDNILYLLYASFALSLVMAFLTRKFYPSSIHAPELD